MGTTSEWPAGDGEMARRIREHDWGATVLGPADRWPQSLRTLVDTILLLPGPATILWGPSHVQIYNDPYIAVAQHRHPGLLGAPVELGWGDAYGEVIRPLLEAAQAGRATRLTDYRVALTAADGTQEERWFDTDWSPVPGEDGEVAGILQTIVEVTARRATEHALRKGEKRFRALATAGSQAIYRMNPDWTEMFELRGRGFVEDVVGPDSNWAASYVFPADQPAVRAAIDEAIRTKSVFELTHRVRRTDGSVGWTHSRAVPILDDAGSITEWFGAASDVTEAKLREEKDAFLLKLSDTLRPLVDPIAVQETASLLLGQQLGADNVNYGVINTEAKAVVVAREYRVEAAPSTIGSFSFANFETVLRTLRTTKRTLQVDDTATSSLISDEERRTILAIEVGAFVTTPLVKAGRHVASLTVTSLRPRSWTASEIGLIEETAERTWAAVERATAEAALRSSEDRFRTLAASIEDVFYITDLNRGQLAYLSPSYEKVWGRPVTDLLEDLGRFADTIHPDDRERMTAGLISQRAGQPILAEYRIVRADGELRHILDRSFPVPGKERDLSAGVARDVTDSKVASIALRESEIRLRSLIEGIPQLVWRAVDGGQWTWASPQWTEFTGQSNEDSQGKGWLGPLHPDDRPVAQEAWSHAMDTGGFELEYRLRRASDGRYRWFQTRAAPVRNDAGEIIEWLGTSTDIHDRRAASEALRESEERFRQFGEASSDLLWIRNAETMEFEYVSPAFDKLYGVPRSDLDNVNDLKGWAKLVHPEDRDLAVQSLYELRHGRPNSMEWRVVGPEGDIRWLHNTDFPLLDEAGNVQRIAGIAHDVTERKRALELQSTLLAELQHRVRNILALIRSVVARTARGATSLDSFVDHLQGRIDAMARTQVMLTRSPGETVDLEQLLREEMLAQAAPPDRYRIAGPTVALSPKATEVLSLALHELATNSVKYGALARDSGYINIDWEVRDSGGEPWLQVRWDEHSSVIGERRRTAGFGTELITRRVPYELAGRGEMELKEDGVCATIEFPLRGRGSVLQTSAGFLSGN